MKKRLLALGLSAVMLFSGCASDKSQTTTGTDEKNLEEFNVVLDWYPNALHSFIYNAIEKGYYEEEGLKVNIQFPANTNDAISLTAAGKADVGIYYMHDLVMAKVEQDIPVKSIGTICQKPLNIVLSLKDKNITEPKDLIGKTVGYAGTELSESIIKFLVENAGGKNEDVNYLDVGFDLMSSMTTGNVDATIGCLVNHEVPQMQEEGFDVNYFFPNDYGMPNYYECVFVTGENQVKNESEKLTKFLRASAKGFEDMKNDPDGSIDILLANQNAENFPLDENVEKKSINMLVPIMETENAKFLSQDKAVWDENIQWLYDNGIISKTISSDDIVVDLYEQ
ncbi:MAG TPA: ABC transporter substrate-binding protein [Lachnospiraceae bacterium]|nr:ABC transporter substrate-binding protein [Lachnospiraceae bacterium]